MTLPIALPRTLLVTAIALVGFTACSSDSNKTTADDLSTIDATLPAGVTLPGGVTLPPGITGDCQAIYIQFVSAMTSAFVPNASVDYTSVFGDVSTALPADLQDDVAVLSTAFQAYGQILASNNNDMSKPEVQAALQALGTPEVNAASAAVQAYFDETCPNAT